MAEQKEGKDKPIFGTKDYLLIIGLILMLFASVLFFTMPVLFNILDLSETGQIGDTIGGITAPIINLVGAVLVFISFKAQIRANQIQHAYLKKEIEEQNYDRNFQVALELFKGLKEDFNDLEYHGGKGQIALNKFLEGSLPGWGKTNFKSYAQGNSPIYTKWEFVMFEYYSILRHIKSEKFRAEEDIRIFFLVHKYYKAHLEIPAKQVKWQLEEVYPESETLKLLNQIIERHNSWFQKLNSINK